VDAESRGSGSPQSLNSVAVGFEETEDSPRRFSRLICCSGNAGQEKFEPGLPSSTLANSLKKIVIGLSVVLQI